MPFSSLLMRAHTLTVLERVTQTPLFLAYQRTLEALDEDALSFAKAYSTLCRHLYRENGAKTFTNAILTDDNALTITLPDAPRKLEAPLSRDLDTLHALLALSDHALTTEASARLNTPTLTELPPLPAQENLNIRTAQQLIDIYQAKGYGRFAQNSAFSLDAAGDIQPVRAPDLTTLADLIGYERERHQLLQNTLAFLEGKPANNALLYGDKGTGKSSTIKAVANEYAARGLKILSVTANDCGKLPMLFEQLATAPFHFILFLDDLSFQPEDENFTALKAFIEGGLHHAPKNVLIYATSNRRHLVAERFSDRQGDAVSVRDVLESSASLSDRFGLQITFSVPDKKSYLQIVEQLCAQNGIEMDVQELHTLAERFALRRNGRSPRTAHQFVHHLLADSLPKPE